MKQHSGVLKLISAFLVAGIVGACSFGEKIADQATDYNKAAEEASVKQILLNVLRGKDRRQMQFTAVSQIRGSLSISSTGSLGLTVPFGGDASSTFTLSPSLNLSHSSSPSFDVAILDTKEFMSGILTPVDMKLIEYYWQQGWPKDLLLYLFIREVKIEKQAEEVKVEKQAKKDDAPTTPVPNDKTICEGRVHLSKIRITNNPDYTDETTPSFDDPCGESKTGAFQNFQSWIQYVREHELTVESVDSGRRIGPPLSLAKASLKQLVEAEEAKLRLVLLKDEAHKGKYQLCKPITTYKFCFTKCKSKTLLEACTPPPEDESETESSGKTGNRTYPGKPTNPGKQILQTEIKPYGKVTFTLNIRSIEGILFYLGELTRRSEKKGEYVKIKYKYQKPKRLFVLTSKPLAEAETAVAVDYDGKTYRIPKNAGESLHVLSLVAQLLALHKERKDLPTTSVVQTVQ